jgi:phosphoadenosine phosphosulfate reductase
MLNSSEMILQQLGDTESWSTPQVLHWGLNEFHPRIALATGFGAEGMVLIDMAARIRVDFRVFTLDTDFLFPETYALAERIEKHYGIKIERCRPQLTPEQQARKYGEALWSFDPDRCCALRKVEPLREKLSELSAWVTGIRRDQASTRAQARKVEWDEKFGLLKLNPLADWTSERVWDYIRRHQVPYNPLHDRNYPSIGCTHCTRPVMPGEDSRAGRWPGFQKTECGLHVSA